MTDEELRDHLGPVWDHLIDHGLYDLARERIAALLSTRIQLDWLGALSPRPVRELACELVEQFLRGLELSISEPPPGRPHRVRATYGRHAAVRSISRRRLGPDSGNIPRSIGWEMGRELRHHLEEGIRPAPEPPVEVDPTIVDEARERLRKAVGRAIIRTPPSDDPDGPV